MIKGRRALNVYLSRNNLRLYNALFVFYLDVNLLSSS
jgi:hypothetical protein